VEDTRHAVSDKVREHIKALKSGVDIPEKDDDGRKPLEGDWYLSLISLPNSNPHPPHENPLPPANPFHCAIPMSAEFRIPVVVGSGKLTRVVRSVSKI